MGGCKVIRLAKTKVVRTFYQLDYIAKSRTKHVYASITTGIIGDNYFETVIFLIEQ